MKTLITIFTVLLFANISFSQKHKGKNEMGKHKESKSDKNHEMEHQKLRHVVIFKFKDGSSAEDIKKVEDAFRELPKKINMIKGYEWGINNSTENLNQGFTHCFFVTFSSEADRDAYIIHPDHKAFVANLGALDKAFVVDYWVKD
jgi:Stress responsive A/B Barrel Domain